MKILEDTKAKHVREKYISCFINTSRLNNN